MPNNDLDVCERALLGQATMAPTTAELNIARGTKDLVETFLGTPERGLALELALDTQANGPAAWI